jgi:hypothetical protein
MLKLPFHICAVNVPERLIAVAHFNMSVEEAERNKTGNARKT